MYQVDEHDEVVPLDALPRPDVGAPSPTIVAAEHHLELAYITSGVGTDTDSESVVVATFTRPYAHAFGPPNDEALGGHPLAARDLRPYSVFKVQSSSWIRRLEQMNRANEDHRPGDFDVLTHFIFVFHDTTFECVAAGVTISRRPGQSVTLEIIVTI